MKRFQIMYKAVLTLVGFTICCISSGCVHAQSRTPLYQFHFEDTSNLGPVVEVNIGQSKKLRMALDTGASFCVLKPGIVDGMNVKSDVQSIHTFGDREDFKYVGNFSIQLSKGFYERQQSCFTPATKEGESPVDMALQQVDGILGMDFFKGTTFELDGPEQIIRIYKTDPNVKDIFTAKLGVAFFRNNYYQNIKIDDNIYRVLLDSGLRTYSNVLFYDWATPNLEHSKKAHPSYKVSVPFFSRKDMKRSLRKIDYIPESDSNLYETLITYDGSPLRKALLPKDINDGYIGWGIMRKGVSYYDLIGDEYSWSSRYYPTQTLDVRYNQSGFTSTWDPDKRMLRVTHFSKYSPVRDAGIKIDDLIVSMNGVRVSSQGYTGIFVINALSATSSKTLTLRIERTGVQKNYTIELKDFLRMSKHKN